MRVAVVSTYPPRACGIGTFSEAVRTALLRTDASTAVDIVSIVRDHKHADAAEVVATIRQDARSDYPAIGRLLTSRGTDVVLVEHEYGIFGGVDGAFVLSLVAAIRQPLVVTLHTVLSKPSVSQAETLRALCHRATLVTVFTETARRMVVEARLVPPERVRVIPHGAPTELLPVLREAAGPIGRSNGHASSGRETALQMAGLPRPALERLEGHTVLSTFGLISAGKGIETAIAALPAILERHPDVFYLIAGQTHPEVVKREGERYRLGLERLVADLGITENVHFVDRFFTDDELAVLLQSTDLYITPYRSREQIVSGALTFAVVAGCPVVSTPYYYAEDLLGSGAGVLVPFDDPTALAEGVLSLLDDPVALQTAAAEARRIGAELTWPAVGAQTLKVLAEAVSLGPVVGEDDGEEVVPAAAPGIRPDHLLTLVDDVGIIQHADGVVPNRASGYCVDDVARLVIVSLALDRSDMTYTRVLARGVSFLRHAWDPQGGGMHNFMSYDRQWLDTPNAGDHIGRAAWALGEVVAAQPPSLVGSPCLRLLEEMAPDLARSLSPRCVAYAALGLSRIGPDLMSAQLRSLLDTLAGRLLDWFNGVAHAEWQWFEDSLAYDNGRLSQALIAAGHRLGDKAMLDAGLSSLSWYAAQCGIDGPVLRLVGNDWRRRGEPHAEGHEGDEQPLDAAALVEAYVEAMIATGHTPYGRKALRAFEWFLGRNRLGVPVYDFATGGCHDGIGTETVNDNEGAESTLSFLQALLALDGAGLQASLPQP